MTAGSDEEADWEGPRKPVRNTKDYPGYPSDEVREGIRQWGSSEDWQLWRSWEEFIRGESNEEPESLADWLPEHELVERERQREAEEAKRRRRQKLNRRAEFVMREQISALKHALGRGYIRSPLKFAYEGYPSENARTGDGKGKGMWGGAAWQQNHAAYAHAWEDFMTGKSENPPDPGRVTYPAGWAVQKANKGYIGNDPPAPASDRWPDQPDEPEGDS